MIGTVVTKWMQGTAGRFVLLFSVGALLFLFALSQGGFLGWFLFSLFLPIVFYVALLLLYPFQSVQVERSIKKSHYFSGDTIHTEIKLKRRWLLPFFLVTVHEDTKHPFVLSNEKSDGLLVWFGREATFTLMLTHVQRGKCVFTGVVLNVSDPFGFFEKTVRLPCTSTVYVYPQLHYLSLSALSLRQQGLYQTAQETDRSGFSGVRTYRPNDRPSWLDWKSTARTNVLVTKQFETERELLASVALVCSDQDSDQLFDDAVSCTASLVKALIGQGVTVLLTYRIEGKPLLLHATARQALTSAFRALAELTKEQALTIEDVVMSGNKRKMGYAVSTDSKLAASMKQFANISRQHQTMFFLTENTGHTKMKHMNTAWFTLNVLPRVEQSREKAGE
ncbi:DUF58 domain-containing protein [Sporolactobacillus kofuensis]|uniref:DUF58 domain-containing protein n=1 Tax=Sporolactobacillus kofuensis TaxID=269672 RepID=A0ABW1WH62_9BACL|nr:DUF58 domain-containing protein [Sporolactobacillus kofuensis]MCO7176871.1 DUF58 domain-containing protein [Sporolactobacillus kofuensis]